MCAGCGADGQEGQYLEGDAAEGASGAVQFHKRCFELWAKQIPKPA